MKVHDPHRLRDILRDAFPFRILPAHNEQGHFYKREDTGRVAASVTTKLGFASKPYLYGWYVKRALDYVREYAARLGSDLEGVLKEASGAAVRSRDESAKIGTTAHDAIDRYITSWIETGTRGDSAVGDLTQLCSSKGVEPKVEEIAACRSFDKFLAEIEVIPLASELRVWYEKGGDCFAGTIDSVLLLLSVRKERNGAGILCVSGAQHEYTPQDSGVFWCSVCSRECDPKLIEADWKTSNAIKEKDEYALQTEAYGKAIEVATKIKFDDIWVVRFEKKYADYEILRVSDRKQAWAEWLSVSRAYDQRASREGAPLLTPLTAKKVERI